MALFMSIAELLKKKESFVLATILHRCGSAPRDVGSRMVIRSDGSIMGSIGGGILEAKVRELGRELFKSRKTVLKNFVLNDKAAAPIGMICGGDVELLMQFEDAAQPARLEYYEELLATLGSRRRAWLTIRLPDREFTEGLPAQYIVKGDGTSSLEDQGLPRMKELLAHASSTHPAVVEHEGERFFIEPLCSEGTVYIFGAGHVGQKVVHLTKFVGFQTVVLDDRKEFANRELCGSADRIEVLESLEKATNGLDIDADSYIVIVTRGHAHDRTVLAQALRTPAGYIGMIGSRTKRDAIYESLAGEGFTDRDFARVNAPVGLNIGAETPEEIAVSIVGELIRKRAGRFQ